MLQLACGAKLSPSHWLGLSAEFETQNPKRWLSATHFFWKPQSSLTPISSRTNFLPSATNPKSPFSPFPAPQILLLLLPCLTPKPTAATTTPTMAVPAVRRRRRGFRTNPRGRPRTLRERTTYTGWAKSPTTWTSPSEPGRGSLMTFSSENSSAETPISSLIIGRRSPGLSSTFKAIITLRLCSWYGHIRL